jgi:hypothetical protein
MAVCFLGHVAVQNVKQICQTSRCPTPEETIFVKRLPFVIHEAHLGGSVPYLNVCVSSSIIWQHIGLSHFVFPWDGVKKRPHGTEASDGIIVCHLI